VLDRRLTYNKHVLAVTWSCNFHAHAIRHIYTPPIVDRSGTDMACSLILTELDYCNSVLYGTPVSSMQNLQRVQNNAARIVLQAPTRSHAIPLMRQLHWLPVQHRIDYEVSVLTYKSLNTSVSRYLSQRVNRRVNARTLHSTATPLLIQPFARTDFAKRSFRCAAPSVWNSLPASVIGSDSLSVFKSKLKAFLFRKSFN